MTADQNPTERGPGTGLSDPESLQDPRVGTERRPGGEFVPQTGAQGFRGEQEPRVGTKKPCRHCGEQIVYEPYFLDGRGPNPPVWAHTTGAKTCGTRPKNWRRDKWPMAEPEPAHIPGPANADDCPGCVAATLKRAEDAEAALDRVLAFCADIDDPAWRAPGTEVALRIRSLIAGEPASTPAGRHDDGPTVREAAEADARWWNGEKAGES